MKTSSAFVALLGALATWACSPKGSGAAGPATASAVGADASAVVSIGSPTSSATVVPTAGASAPTPLASAKVSMDDSAAPPHGAASASAAVNGTSPPIAKLALPDEGPFRVIDLHVDTPWRVHFKGRAKNASEGPATPLKLASGHYAGVVYPIYLPDYLHDGHPTIADADAVYTTIAAIVTEQEVLVPAEGDVPADKVGVFVSIEGAGAFADDITQIDRFVKRGVKLIGPAHARDNRLAGAATGKKRGGLTDLGKQFCERVYAAGGLVDVSHLSDAAFDDLVPIAKKFGAPIVATHSNARAKHKHRRNLTDDELRVIGETGGVAGLNLHRGFLGGAKLQTVVTMVKHMVAVAGIDHVALGTDFEGATPTSALKDASTLPALAEALKKAGLDDAAIRKVFAKNAMRILAWEPPPK